MSEQERDDQHEAEPDEGGSGGESDHVATGLPDADDVDQSEIDEIEAERQERLSAENRPDNVEVDNTQRTFDEEAGMFTDNDDYDESEKPYAAGGE